MEQIMIKAAITALLLAVAAFTGGAVQAAQDSIAGTWTLSVERLPMRLVLAEKDGNVTGTLDYPHGAPFKLAGSFASGTLRVFSAADSQENFSAHIDMTGSPKADGSLEGSIKVHFIERDDAGKVLRTRDQVIMWTAVRTPPK
jgi:hypothetical protein